VNTMASTRKGKWGSAAVHLALPAALLTLAATAGPTTSGALPKEPKVMSALKVEGLAGVPVIDANGRMVGEVQHVEADYLGRTRYINLVLEDGRPARIAAFQASWDPREREIELAIPRYAVERTASAQQATMMADAGEPNVLSQ
jgi:sporulation protein YlmC with PRC-barrel domain